MGKSKTDLIILFITLIFIILTSYLGFQYYKSNFSNYYLTNLIISSFAVVTFISIFFLNRNLKEKILLVLISSYITLFCVEIFLNIHTTYFKEAAVYLKHSEYEKRIKKKRKICSSYISSLACK